jgi:SpoVK/Ycf46/Vps4 family AAA+-type ATPase
MAILRPGRFDHLVYIGLPDKVALEQIVNLHTK